jgi:hypothetical protein
MRIVLLLVTLGSGAALGECNAQASPRYTDLFVAPTMGLNLTTGIGSPLGWLGVESELTPLSWLSVSGGVGFARYWDPQLGATLRTRWIVPSRVGAFTAGFGMSRGRYTWRESCLFDFDGKCRDEKTGIVWWNNLEFGFEVRAWMWGLPGIWRSFLGVALPGNPRSVVCIRNSDSTCHDGTGPFVFVGISGGVEIPLISPRPRFAASTADGSRAP